MIFGLTRDTHSAWSTVSRSARSQSRRAAFGSVACSDRATRAASRRSVATLGVARQSVIWDWLPRRGVGDELTDAWSDCRILVERPHPDADRIRVSGIAAVQRRAAVATEPLLTAVVRLPPAKPVLTGD